jgi:predicted MFS family arabinose efflux permease
MHKILMSFRKTGLLLNNIPAVIGSVLMVMSKLIASFEAFIIGRILIGFSAGLKFHTIKEINYFDFF